MVKVGVRLDNENSFLLTPGIWHLAFGIWSFSFLRDGLEIISQLVQSGSGPQPTRPKNYDSNLRTKNCIDCIGCMTVRFYGHQMNFSIVRVDEHLLWSLYFDPYS